MAVGERTEEELLRHARDGSLDARAELFRRHVDAAWRAALFVTGQREAAEDAVQEAFIRAFAALGSFDGRRPFAAWLYRIVVNQALNATRRDRGRLVTFDVAFEHGRGVEDEWAAVIGSRSDIRRALATLSADQRAVIALRYWADLAPGDIAKALGIREGTVRSRLSRALAALRETLEEDR